MEVDRKTLSSDDPPIRITSKTPMRIGKTKFFFLLPKESHSSTESVSQVVPDQQQLKSI
jgi:hypothetical protein